MNLTAHVSRDFKQLTIPAKIAFGGTVVQDLQTNAAKFQNPKISPASLATTNATLNSAYLAARTGDHAAVAAEHTAEAEWDAQYEIEAAYVDSVALGSAETIFLAGYYPTKTGGTPPALPLAPTIKKIITNQQPGSIQVELAVQRNVQFILIVSSDASVPIFTNGQYSIASNPKALVVLFDSGRKTDITGLPSHASLFVTALAVNNTGFGPACPAMAANTL
jgi:hypothetical protein